MMVPTVYVHPDVKSTYEHWCAISPYSRLPSLQQFDLTDVPHLKSRLGLIDIQRDPIKFQYRHAGNDLEEFAHEKLSGKKFAERLTGSRLQRAEKYLRYVADTGRPSWRRGRSEIRWEKEEFELECLYLPLAGNGMKVDTILVVIALSRLPFSGIPLTDGPICQFFPPCTATGKDKFPIEHHKNSDASSRSVLQQARNIHLALLEKFISSTKGAKAESSNEFIRDSLDDQIEQLSRQISNYRT